MKSSVNENCRAKYVFLDFFFSLVLGMMVFYAVNRVLAGMKIPFLGMFMGMAIGSIVALVFSNVLAPICGIFEIMIPFHFIGMYGGMFWAMAVVHEVYPFYSILISGGLCGIFFMACFYILNSRYSGFKVQNANSGTPLANVK